MNKPTILLLTQFLQEKGHRTIRLCIPGIDKGGAVYLEAEIEGDDVYCEEILKQIHSALQFTEIDPRD
jgi:hypothetical protein